MKHHRPLERTKALEHCTSSPPKVSRHYKPFYPLEVPAIPPRPKKLINPEDAFPFEIIDIDEQHGTDFRHIVAPLATPESELFGGDPAASSSSRPTSVNHSSQICDIRLNANTRPPNPPKYPSLQAAANGQELANSCFLAVPEQAHTSVSPVSPNSGGNNSGSTPTSDSGVAFSEVGYRDYSSSSTESEFESTKGYRDGGKSCGAFKGHKILSRQISHPPDNRMSQFLHRGDLQCPPTPTHHARRFRNDNVNGTSSQRGMPSSSSNQNTGSQGPSGINAPAAVSSSESDSEAQTSSQSLRRRTMRLPSISENTRIQRVDVLPDGDRLPAGKCLRG